VSFRATVYKTLSTYRRFHLFYPRGSPASPIIQILSSFRWEKKSRKKSFSCRYLKLSVWVCCAGAGCLQLLILTETFKRTLQFFFLEAIAALHTGTGAGKFCPFVLGRLASEAALLWSLANDNDRHFPLLSTTGETNSNLFGYIHKQRKYHNISRGSSRSHTTL
jgi:hypothetical protein